jgi:hypothetical protein
MAAWQFTLDLIPQTSIARLADDVYHVDPSALERTDWWRGATLPREYEQSLAAFLPWQKPWHPNWKIFGDMEGTRVDLISENGRLTLVQVRLDARGIEDAVLQRLARWASDCGGVFVTAAGQVVEPNADAILVELAMSPAAEFVRNPEAFFERLRRNPL